MSSERPTPDARRLDDAGMLQMLAAWTSPAFPTSAFAYAHGLEAAVASGDVDDGPSAEEWISACVSDGAGRSDAMLLAEAHRAWSARDAARLASATELACALAPSAERRLEMLEQGRAFFETARAAWPTSAPPPLSTCAPLPVAIGAMAAAHGAPLRPTALFAAQAFAAQLLSAAQRLVPLGQTDAQTRLAAMAPLIGATVDAALAADLDEIGGAAWAADIASMRHETQTVRLFRS